jgi:hypothetical protein
MRRLALLLPLLALSACTDLPDKAKRSDVAAICRDGTSVLRDQRDGSLSTLKVTRDGILSGDVAPGVTAAEVCK